MRTLISGLFINASHSESLHQTNNLIVDSDNGSEKIFSLSHTLHAEVNNDHFKSLHMGGRRQELSYADNDTVTIRFTLIKSRPRIIFCFKHSGWRE